MTNMTLNFLERKTRFEKGGAGAAPTVSSTPPPPTNTSVEVQQARRQAAKEAAKRKGLAATTFAGETGGYRPTLMGNAPATGTQPKATVLGG
jgi:hypothetical protein